jgi:hypothetical protein
MTIKTDIPTIAREALAILDRDGWNKGAVTLSELGAGLGYTNGERFHTSYTHYPVGSHCIGGAWNLALHGADTWDTRLPELYQPLVDILQAEWPERTIDGYDRNHLSWVIAYWNNHPRTTEADVRRVLEKLAAG